MKKNVATAFAQRVISLSHPKHHLKNYGIITRLLKNNNYPAPIIKKIITKAKYGRAATEELDEASTDNEKRYLKFPYVPILTDKIEKRIRAVTDKIVLAKKPFKKLQSVFSNLKSSFKKPTKGCVYKFDCKDCDATYIGETERNIETRISEHRNDIKRERENKIRAQMQRDFPGVESFKTRAQTNAIEAINRHIQAQATIHPKGTAALQHQLTKNHTMDHDGFCILEKERFKPKLQILEAMYTQFHRPTAINFKVDTSNLNPTTKRIIHLYRHFKYKK